MSEHRGVLGWRRGPHCHCYHHGESELGLLREKSHSVFLSGIEESVAVVFTYLLSQFDTEPVLKAGLRCICKRPAL